MRLAWLGLCAALPLSLLLACSSSSGAGPANGDGGPDGDGSVSDGSASDADATTDGGADGDTPDDSLPSGVRDRDGRPYVSLILVSLGNRTEYNAEPVDQALTTDPTDTDGGPTFGADFQSTLVMLDGLDGTNDWNGGAATAGPDDAGVYPHPLANSWIAVDALLVDPNKPFSPSGYLDIEANGAAHTTCGGRWLSDDALDKTMSFLVKKSRTGVSDGVAAPAKPASLTFPYLAEPF